MAVEITYTKARANFARLWDRVVADRETLIITRRGKPGVALIAADELASLEETVHLLRSPRSAARLLTALNDALAREGAPQVVGALRAELAVDDRG